MTELNICDEDRMALKARYSLNYWPFTEVCSVLLCSNGKFHHSPGSQFRKPQTSSFPVFSLIYIHIPILDIHVYVYVYVYV
jgi:hypothetical protein